MSSDWDLVGGISGIVTGGVPFAGFSHPDAISGVDWTKQYDTKQYALGTSPEMLEARRRAIMQLNSIPADYGGQMAAAYSGPVASAARKTGGVGMGGVAGDQSALAAQAAVSSARQRMNTVRNASQIGNTVNDWQLRQDNLKFGLHQRERAKLAREQAAKKAAAFGQQAANMQFVGSQLQGGSSMAGGGGGGGGGMGMSSMKGMMGGGGAGGAGGGAGAGASGAAGGAGGGGGSGGGGGGGGVMASSIFGQMLQQAAPMVNAMGQSNPWEEDYYGNYGRR